MPKAMSQNLHGIRIFKPLYIPDANFPSFPFVFDEGEDFMTQQEDQWLSVSFFPATGGCVPSWGCDRVLGG